MTESGASALLARLAVDSDERVSRWAQNTDRRCRQGEVNPCRAVERLLEPFVAAGFVAADACSLTETGEELVAEMLSRKAVAA